MSEAIIKKIYLDMDGVIADFDRRYKARYKMLPREAEQHKEFDKFFTQFINDGEFATLDLMPDAMELINFLRGLEIPTEILSSSSSEKRDPDVRPQKLKWLKNNNIEFPAVIVPGKRHKKEYSNENTLLIDDTAVNIDQWRREGGIGILHTDTFTTINILKMYV
jgi:beta-phosphoglucomutase-like phosphatase (HAD superfamily)